MNSMSHNLLSLANRVSKYCVGMEGNVSTKNGKELLIKASGTKLSRLTMDDLVPFDFNGTQLDNLEKKGSMELSFHTYLLGFEGINYVAHTHPVNSLKILCSEFSWEFSKFRLFPDQVVFNGGKSCLVPYAKPGIELTELIKLEVEKFIKNEGYFPKLILLKNHGVITCGKTIDECVISTEICEKSAEIFSNLANTGKGVFLSEASIKELMDDEEEKYRQNQLR